MRKINWMGVAALLTAAAAVLIDHTLLGEAAALYSAIPIVGSLSDGISVDTDKPDTHRVPSVSDMLLQVEPYDFVVTQILDKLGRSEPVKQIIHQWGEKGRLPRYVELSGALSGGAGEGTASVNAVNAIKPGDILVDPANATDASVKYYVKSTDAAADEVVIVALPQDTSGTDPRTPVAYPARPAIASGAVLYWIGNAKSEADAASRAVGMFPTYKFNYVQTIDHKIAMSDHAQRFANYGPQDWPRELRDGMYEFRKSREFAMVFSTAASVTKDTNLNGEEQLTHTMAGLYGYIDSAITLPTAATVDDLISLGYDAFLAADKNNASNRGTRRKLMIGGSAVMEVVDKAAAGSDLFVRQSERIAGMVFDEIRTRAGSLFPTFHPGFDETGRSGEALILDLSLLSRGVLQEVEDRDLDLKRSAKGVDADARQLIVKETLICGNAAGAHHKVSLG